MTVTNTSLLGLALPTTGTESGVWGDDVNNGLTILIDVSVAGTNNITQDSDITLAVSNGNNSSSFTSTATNSAVAQYYVLNCSGARTALRNIIVPTTSKTYVVTNGTTGGFGITVKKSGGTGVTVAAGETAIVFYNTVTGDVAKVSSLNTFGAITATSITNSSLTSGRVVYSTTGGLETDSANFTFNGTTVTMANDASISGLTVGRGASALSSNTAVGASALAANTTGFENVAVGLISMNANTTGTYNTATGRASLYSNTTGNYNSGFGDGALQNNTTASNNTAVGYQAGYSNTTGNNSQFFGYLAGYNHSTGAQNIAIGDRAMHTGVVTGSNNVALGAFALDVDTSGSYNMAIGAQALQANTTASNNTAVGYQAGQGITTGSNNTYVGYTATQSGVAVTGEIVLCTNTATGKGSNTGFISPNGGGVYQGNNSAAWSVTSDQRLKKNIVDNNVGLDKVIQIQVRNFEYRTEDEITDLPKNQAIKKEGVQLGVIAQELQQVLPDCVKQESTGVLAVDSTDIMYHMINAIKELNAKITALEAKLGA